MVTLSGDAYLFSITMSDIVSFMNEIRAEDPQLAQYLDDLGAAIEKQLDIDVDDWSILSELPLTLSGYYLPTENGDYVVSLSIDLAIDDDESVHMDAQLAVLNDANNVSAFFFLNASEDEEVFELSLEIKIPYNEGDTKIVLTATVWDDDENESLTLTFENSAASQTALSLHIVDNSLYSGEWFTEEGDIALIYTYQDAVTSEDRLTYPGHLCLQMSFAGTSAALDIDTSLSLYTSSQAYAAPASTVDMTTADRETLSALEDDALSVVYQGLMILLQSSGIDVLLGM